jgi:capsular polysaccharide biosynthesis protein
VDQGRKGITDRRRRRWHTGPNQVWWKLAVVVLAAYIVTSISFMQPPRYEADVVLLVGQEHNWPGSPIPTPAVPLQDLAQTVAQAVDSRPVAEEARRRLKLDTPTDELLRNLAAKQIEGTQFIRVGYTDTNPERAQRVANTVGAVFSAFVYERSAGESRLTTEVWTKASVPTTPASPHPWRNGLLVLTAGLLLLAVPTHGAPHSLAARAAQSAGGLLELWSAPPGRRRSLGFAKGPSKRGHTAGDGPPEGKTRPSRSRSCLRRWTGAGGSRRWGRRLRLRSR